MIARPSYVDARTSGNWFVMSAMGRSAGHLAFGIGEACHYPMIVIPKCSTKTPITIDKIIRLMVSSIVKRRIVGMDYGAAVISEGVFHELSEADSPRAAFTSPTTRTAIPNWAKCRKPASSACCSTNGSRS